MTEPKEPEPFDSDFWSGLEEQCPCQGDGWVPENRNWGECATHFQGQLHPESRELLLDDPVALLEAERISILNWKILLTKKELAERQALVKESQKEILRLELELINKTPTIKMDAIMEALVTEDLYLVK